MVTSLSSRKVQMVIAISNQTIVIVQLVPFSFQIVKSNIYLFQIYQNIAPSFEKFQKPDSLNYLCTSDFLTVQKSIYSSQN